jgi:tetratricopeptide (TPR) repeat protein
MNDLEIAMKRDPKTADKMFSIEGTEPTKTSKPCAWNLTDLDTLVAKFPKDYRAWIFRGLYYQFFTTFKEDYYAKAFQQFQEAAVLNPNSPLPNYFVGEVHTKASIWTKKAWASDAGRDDATKNAVQAYTKAIQLDPKFLPAIEERASGYLSLKQYPQALKDYDKILSLDPENTTAYSDRGIAKLETGQYFSATFDFKDAIRRKSGGDSFLPNLYEYLGDANVKLGYYREAITDYTNAIENQLSNETLLLSLKNFRALYPEYEGVSDDALCQKLHALFFPNLEYKDFAKMLMVDNTQHANFLLGELYEKRGDTYLEAGDYRRGVLDFNRIFKGIPDMGEATDRWRPVGTSADGEQFYLDVKSFEPSTGGPVRLWVKTVGKKETDTVAYEMDLQGEADEQHGNHHIRLQWQSAEHFRGKQRLAANCPGYNR